MVGGTALFQQRRDGVYIVDAAAPHPPLVWTSAAHNRVSAGRAGWGRRSGAASAERGASAFFRAERLAITSDKVDGAMELDAVDDDLDLVAFLDLSDCASGKGFGRDVADAGSGGDAAEARVSEHGDVMAERKRLECRGDLVDLLHAGSGGSAADEDDDVSGGDATLFDGEDGGFFGDENPRRAEVPVLAVFIDEAGIDGCALDDRAFGREIADGKADGRSEAALAGAVGRHDDVVGVDSVLIVQVFSKLLAARALLHQSRHASNVSPVTVVTLVSSRPARRRCSMTSGIPPARKTWTVAKFCGPLGSASTRRGTWRFTCVQSATVGRGRPAAWAMAGRWSSRFVEPPMAACTTMAFWTEAEVRMPDVPRRS